jgi:hypothetical protein
MIRWFDGKTTWKGNWTTRRKPDHVSTRPPQIPYYLTWHQPRSSAVGVRGLASVLAGESVQGAVRIIQNGLSLRDRASLRPQTVPVDTSHISFIHRYSCQKIDASSVCDPLSTPQAGVALSRGQQSRATNEMFRPSSWRPSQSKGRSVSSATHCT